MKLNEQQKNWISDMIEQWYIQWQHRITRDPRQSHNLEIAKEELKEVLCPLNKEEGVTKCRPAKGDTPL